MDQSDEMYVVIEGRDTAVRVGSKLKEAAHVQDQFVHLGVELGPACAPICVFVILADWHQRVQMMMQKIMLQLQPVQPGALMVAAVIPVIGAFAHPPIPDLIVVNLTVEMVVKMEDGVYHLHAVPALMATQDEHVKQITELVLVLLRSHSPSVKVS
jgi:hypothetical protein